MKILFVSIATLIHCLSLLLRKNGTKKLIAEMILLRSQLIISKRKLTKSPKLKPSERLLFAISLFFIPFKRVAKVGILVQPSTLLKFHRLMVKRKYSKLFRNKIKPIGRPPISMDFRNLIIKIKSENPSFGCQQIAHIISNRTGTFIDDETVRRILKKFYKPKQCGDGPSWLSFLGSQADSLWSCDLFCVESLLLKTHWVLIVMDQYSPKIIGYAVQSESVRGQDLCRMYNEVASGRSTPKRLSRDNDPLFQYFQWIANMDIYEIEQIRSVPFTPTSHPFCERVIGTTRREFTDKILFWNEADLNKKLESYTHYFNNARVHSGINAGLPQDRYSGTAPKFLIPSKLQWQSFCRGLFKVPISN